MKKLAVFATVMAMFMPLYGCQFSDPDRFISRMAAGGETVELVDSAIDRALAATEEVELMDPEAPDLKRVVELKGQLESDYQAIRTQATGYSRGRAIFREARQEFTRASSRLADAYAGHRLDLRDIELDQYSGELALLMTEVRLLSEIGGYHLQERLRQVDVAVGSAAGRKRERLRREVSQLSPSDAGAYTTLLEVRERVEAYEHATRKRVKPEGLDDYIDLVGRISREGPYRPTGSWHVQEDDEKVCVFRGPEHRFVVNDGGFGAERYRERSFQVWALVPDRPARGRVLRRTHGVDGAVMGVEPVPGGIFDQHSFEVSVAGQWRAARLTPNGLWQLDGSTSAMVEALMAEPVVRVRHRYGSLPFQYAYLSGNGLADAVAACRNQR